MAKSSKIEIEKKLRLKEADRMLTIARRKKQVGDSLSQALFRVESVQMYQQAMELCLKAVMTVLVGYFYTEHDFAPKLVEETLKALKKEWPQRPEFFLERSFRVANRWSPERVLGTYGYSHGSSGEIVISEEDRTQAGKDAQYCVNTAWIITDAYRQSMTGMNAP